MKKPRYPSTSQPDGFTILYRVRDALMTAGHLTQVDEFLARALRCASEEDLQQLAAEYVDFDE
jgi:hypothetical protein